MICNDVGLVRVEELDIYLGMLLLHKRVTASSFYFLTSEVRNNLNGWESRKLSLASKITLAKSVMLAIPNYSMSIAHILVSICSEIETIARNFIWGSTLKSRRPAHVPWSDCCRPLEFGGLGIRSLIDQNKIFLLKLGFQILANTDALWVKLVKGKYKLYGVLSSAIS